ncbi:hypothetical protein OG218_00910 [Kineococcus sp. NBC_00420]|uniref:hypothetical protein n=1 Tax=Kineococcus sp. NBC_00420 TaxID=2903564 RepID=UPI002E2155C1
MNHRRLVDGWAAWLLILAAALPTVVTIGLGWLAFSGYWDSGPALSRATTGRELLAYRWSSFWFSSPAITTLLLTGLLPLLVLAITAVMNRPRALLLTGAGRNAATAVGGVTIVLGLIEVAGFVAQLTRWLPMHAWAGISLSELITFTPFAVFALSNTVLSVVVTALLRRVKGPTEQLAIDEASGVAVVGVAEEEEAAQPSLASEVADAKAGTFQLKKPPAMPTPSAADLDLYRR